MHLVPQDVAPVILEAAGTIYWTYISDLEYNHKKVHGNT